MKRREHPSFEEWVDFVEGTDAPAARRTIESHLLEGCRGCQETADWVRRITTEMRSDDFVDPPEWVLVRARNLFRPRAADAAAAPRPRILASLVPGLDRAAIPVREAAPRPASRARSYRAGGLEFRIECIQEPVGTWGIRGGLEPLPEVGRPPFVFASVERGDEVVAATPAGPLADFEFTRLAPGVVRVVVEVDGDEYVFEPILLG